MYNIQFQFMFLFFVLGDYTHLNPFWRYQNYSMIEEVAEKSIARIETS